MVNTFAATDKLSRQLINYTRHLTHNLAVHRHHSR